MNDRLTRETLASDGWHLPARYYAADEVAAHEERAIFLTHWLCAGRAEEVARPGDFLTMTIAGEPVLVVRQPGGGVAAFHNRCLHRGVEVASGSGSAERFRCPYHAWTYALDGRLLAAPHMAACVRDGAGLRPLHAAEWRGWIFVNFADAPEPFAEYIGPYEQALWYFRTEECVLARRIVFEIACNWKLVAENLLDVYHVQTTHANTVGKATRTKPEQFAFQPIARGGAATEFKAMPYVAGGVQSFMPFPWLSRGQRDFAAKAALFPNMNATTRPDSMRVWVAWPLDACRSRLECYLLVHRSAPAQRRFARSLDEFETYLRRVVAEDQPVMESIQRAVASSLFQPGPMCRLEGMVQRFQSHYTTLLAEAGARA